MFDDIPRRSLNAISTIFLEHIPVFPDNSATLIGETPALLYDLMGCLTIYT